MTINNLPDEMLSMIFSILGVIDLACLVETVPLVCRQWSRVLRECVKNVEVTVEKLKKLPERPYGCFYEHQRLGVSPRVLMVRIPGICKLDVNVFHLREHKRDFMDFDGHRLKSLRLEMYDGGLSDKSLHDVILGCPNITEINIGNIDTKHVLFVCDHCTNVKHIVHYDPLANTYTNYAELHEKIASSYPNIETLYFSEVYMDDHDLMRYVEKCQTLKKFTAMYSNVSVDAIKRACQLAGPNLKSVYFKGCYNEDNLWIQQEAKGIREVCGAKIRLTIKLPYNYAPPEASESE